MNADKARARYVTDRKLRIERLAKEKGEELRAKYQSQLLQEAIMRGVKATSNDSGLKFEPLPDQEQSWSEFMVDVTTKMVDELKTYVDEIGNITR